MLFLSVMPNEKRARQVACLSSEDERTPPHKHEAGAAILESIHEKLKKLDVLEQINGRLLKIENTVGDMERGLNSMTAELQKVKTDLDSKADFAAIHRSNRAGSSLSRGSSFPLRTTRSAVDWGLENAGFESKTSTAVNQQPQRANTSTATQLLRVKISAQMLTIRQLIQDTVQQSRNSATIKAAVNAFQA